MTTCSAWCRPDKGVHVFLDYSDHPAESSTCQDSVGCWAEMPKGKCPSGRVMSITPAVEAGTLPPRAIEKGLTYPVLITVQCPPVCVET